MFNELKQYIYTYPELSDPELAKKIIAEKPELGSGYKLDTIRRYISFLRELPPDFSIFPPKLLNKAIEETILNQKLVKRNMIVRDFNVDNSVIDKVISNMKLRGYNLKADDEFIQVLPFVLSKEAKRIDIKIFENGNYRFGAIGDTHLASLYERLDVLNALYDIFEKEGITEVFQCGNWVEGESQQNKHEIKVSGIDGQVEYFTDLYPYRKGITTYFISGDDHEGWWQKSDGFRNVGLYAEMVRERKGKNDLKYLGYLEADIEIAHPQTNNTATMTLLHPGGGSAYALSYSTQKIIESLINIKPQILLVGHFHKAEQIFYRNVHAVQVGCVQDQSVWMRKNKIQAHIGGWIIETNQAPDGAINRFKAEFIPFFDERYYTRRGYFQVPEKLNIKKEENGANRVSGE